MNNSIRLTDVREKLITQSFALTGSFHQAGNIDNFNHSRNHILRIHQLDQFIQPFIGNSDHPDIGLYRTKREIGRLRLRITQTIKQGRLSNIRQSDNTTL